MASVSGPFLLGTGMPLFPTRAGGRLSRDAVERLVAKHASAAVGNCPSVKEKNVTPHTLRHTAAMSPASERNCI